MKDICLASSSPRRQKILSALGLDFVIILPVNFEEELNWTAPEKLVCHNALGKARDVIGKHKGHVIIGCDTIVTFQNKIFGKPLTPDNAYTMLKKLSGNYHSVFSGLAVIDTQTNNQLVGHEKAEVKFKDLSEKEINDYIESGGPLDKAGAYGIQECGEVFVESMKGDISTVIGLPKGLLMKFLKRTSITLPL